MGEFLSKVMNFFESIIHPWQLLVLISILSGVLLTNQMSIVDKLSIETEVDEYRIWFLLAFFISAGLLFLRVLSFLKSWAWAWAWFKYQLARVEVSRLSLTEEAKVLLKVLHWHRPDRVQFLTNHPAVRELRLHKLIDTNPYVISMDDYADYGLTQLGVFALRKCETPKYDALAKNDQIEFLRSVSGRDFLPSQHKSWML